MEAALGPTYHVAPTRVMREWGIYGGPVLLDIVRTRESAQTAAEALNTGHCYLDIHLPLGCRVQPVATAAG